ncbi:ABC-2 type transport system permease protein [Amycolatopsis arida]|uniref:ABC-2 type transport system permease protein n=1 Tax=Amycolatopsis arida TaxID=587909 RepID=A0A1I5SIJ2_9PSEU|nr:ABC transporter permease [Amycolatopsis arida]TDX96473.1 ABC-2 type transport system permease protein [Amycolatopsis arida]SFP70166.1 ABC-2 type transport system permease protein [Amycolatopsis arida]
MSPILGTRHLVRLALRRDRIVLPIWVVLIGTVPASMARTYEQFFQSEADRAGLTANMAANPSIAVLYGPAYDLSTAGGFTAWRIGVFVALFTGLMAIFTVTRHTRAEEDTGRGELIGSAVVGRFAMLTAAVLVAGGASVTIGLVQALALIGAGLPAGGAFVFGAATAVTGLVLTGVAAVTAQIAEYSRTANGMASAVLGIAFLVRAVGDSSEATWLSWLSPLGWAHLARPFTGDRWAVIALGLAAAVAAGAVGYALLPRRDFDAGLVRPRPGAATAAPWLGSPLALAWRLHRGALIGWTVVFVAGGAVMGSIADGISALATDNEQAQEIFARMGGSDALVEAFLAVIVGMFGMLVAVYGVQATLRMRAEEVAVRAEPLLATRVSRLRWTWSHLAFAFLGTAWLTLVAGLAVGLTHGLRAGDVPGALGDVLAGTVVQLPAVWLIVGIATLLFGLLPKQVVAVAWAVVALAVLLSLFGPILDLPRVVVDASPFAHVPKLPGAELTVAPLVWLAALATVALAVGLGSFRRRDVG